MMTLVFTPSFAQKTTYDKVEVQVDGLGCPFCAYGTTTITRNNGEVLTSERVEEVREAVVLENVETTSFKVRGNCSMCKARIEKAATSLPGIGTAVWEAETQLIKLEYDPELIDLADIHKAIAKAGHDTQKASAADEVYDNLPPCCLYQREQ